MGTSASSRGPGSGVAFDPPWLDDITLPLPDDGALEGEQEPGKPHEQPNPAVEQAEVEQAETAPPRRFQNARIRLNDFVRTGDQGSFRGAIGHYSRTGMGGARRTARRMRASTRSAANLFGFLQSTREGTDPDIKEWVASLADRGAGAQEIIDEIIRRVAPEGGSPDETSLRDSMAQAMQDVLENQPDADLLHLADDDIWFLIESFLGYEVFSRLCLDIGQAFENSSLSLLDRVVRMKEMRDYLKAEVIAQVEHLKQAAPTATAAAQLRTILQTALRNTFSVYEGSI